jgi:hypothetical protein
MHEITRLAVDKFYNYEDFIRGNTEVDVLLEGCQLWLYDTVIATLTGNRLSLFTGGWKTVTTKERLNGVLSRVSSFRVKQEKGQWFIVNEYGRKLQFEEGITFDLDGGGIVF